MIKLTIFNILLGIIIVYVFSYKLENMKDPLEPCKSNGPQCPRNAFLYEETLIKIKDLPLKDKITFISKQLQIVRDNIKNCGSKYDESILYCTETRLYRLLNDLKNPEEPEEEPGPKLDPELGPQPKGI